MRHLQKILFVIAVTMSTVFYANPENASFEASSKKDSISYEIQKLLRNSQLVIEEDFTAVVIFEVTEDSRLNIKWIKSPNEELNSFLQKRLQNHKLKGKRWDTAKVYELPLKIKAGRQ